MGGGQKIILVVYYAEKENMKGINKFVVLLNHADEGKMVHCLYI